jgi:hypothetical protein
MQRDGLELLVVQARLEGRRKRQIVGGGGELDTGGDEPVTVRRGVGDGPGLQFVRNGGVQGWGFKGVRQGGVMPGMDDRWQCPGRPRRPRPLDGWMGPAGPGGWAGAGWVGPTGSAQSGRIVFLIFFSEIHFLYKRIPNKL